ncbi:GGDEF domain-containing protein [Serratia ureilytica]
MQIGDDVLRTVGERLKTLIRPSDYVCRYRRPVFDTGARSALRRGKASSWRALCRRWKRPTILARSAE